MKEALDYAREKGYEVVWLGVWGENQKAMRFYRKYGFEIFGEHKFLVGNQVDIDLLAKKDLSLPNIPAVSHPPTAKL
jgi:ribosomal protein S18 acetylase RimI-like enzyme